MPINLDLRALANLEGVWQSYNQHSREHSRGLVESARRSLAQIEHAIANKRLELDQIDHDDENAPRRIDQIERAIAELNRINDEVSSAFATCRDRLAGVEASISIGERAGLGELRRMIDDARAYAGVGDTSTQALSGAFSSANVDVQPVSADKPSGRLPKGFVWVSLEEIPAAEYELSASDRAAHFEDHAMSRFLKELPRLAEFVTDRGFIDYDRLMALDRSEDKSVTEGMEAAARAFFGDEPIVMDSRGGNTIINGRHRLNLAAQLGLRYVPVKQL
jgi:hypothetical protein